MKNKEGLAKNWEVVQGEWEDYKLQIVVVLDRVKRTEGIGRKLHHLSGLGPDIHRLMPRSLWYGSVLLAMLSTGVLAWMVVG